MVLILLFDLGANMGWTLCFRPYSGMFGLSSILTTVRHIFYRPRPFRRQTRTKHTSAVGSSKAMFTMIGWSAGGGKHQQAWRILAGRVDLLCVSITSNDSHFLRHCLVKSTALKAYHYTYFYVLIRFSITKLILRSAPLAAYFLSNTRTIFGF